MRQLKEKFNSSRDYKLRLQILTLSPYTIQATSSFFGASNYMVKRSRQLKKEFGILPDVPTLSKGRVISHEEKIMVKNFYERDEISRMCPGMKDCVSVKDNSGQRVKVQKRLILGNLKEIFHQFRNEEEQPKIGFSSFALLRPRHCVLAGSGGTHSVCVCTYHQNPKLQLGALGIPTLDYRKVMGKSVCDTSNRICMLHICKNCPGENGIKEFLQNLEDMEDVPDDIRFKEWVTVDRTQLEDRVLPFDEFLDTVSKSLYKLTRHHFVAETQAASFKKLKQDLKEEEEGILVMDFAENYSFIVQDAAQGFHWENSQCTVHPLVFYYRQNNEILHQSYCFLSDSTKHSTATVFSFLKVLLPSLKNSFPRLLKIHYFSDGCAGQYKNKYNFTNLYHHFNDFGLAAEWHFFATSHGKSACDGIGGIVKRATATASLQRTISNQILTPRDMFNFVKSHLPKIKTFFVSDQDVQATRSSLEERFSSAKVIVGTQRFHRFVPGQNGILSVYETSDIAAEEEQKTIIKQSDDQSLGEDDDVLLRPGDIPEGSFIVCSYDAQLWVGIVRGIDEEFGDFCVEFLEPSGVKASYGFPSRKDICMVPPENLLGKPLSLPKLTGSTRRRYSFKMEELIACSRRLR